MDKAEFDRLRDRLDEDFFRASKRSMVGTVSEVSSGQHCSSGQRPSFTQKAIGPVCVGSPLSIAGSPNVFSAGRVGDVRCRLLAGFGLGLSVSSIDSLRLRSLLCTGGGSCNTVGTCRDGILIVEGRRRLLLVGLIADFS